MRTRCMTRTASWRSRSSGRDRSRRAEAMESQQVEPESVLQLGETASLLAALACRLVRPAAQPRERAIGSPRLRATSGGRGEERAPARLGLALALDFRLMRCALDVRLRTGEGDLRSMIVPSTAVSIRTFHVPCAASVVKPPSRRISHSSARTVNGPTRLGSRKGKGYGNRRRSSHPERSPRTEKCGAYC